jgi:hypothetical protein
MSGRSGVDLAAVDLAVAGRVALSALDDATAAAAIARLRKHGMSDGGVADRLRTTVAIVRTYRGTARNVPPELSEAVGKALVKARALGLCEGCGLVDGQSWSHRIPKGVGGLWSASNGLWLCGSGTTGCHGRLEAARRAHRPLGWDVQRGRDTTTAEAVIWHRGARVRALLDNAGDVVLLGPAPMTEGA